MKSILNVLDKKDIIIILWRLKERDKRVSGDNLYSLQYNNLKAIIYILYQMCQKDKIGTNWRLLSERFVFLSVIYVAFQNLPNGKHMEEWDDLEQMGLNLELIPDCSVYMVCTFPGETFLHIHKIGGKTP